MQRGGLLPVVVFLLAAAGAVWYFEDEILRSFAPAPELTPIPAVVAAPARYDGKQVTVKGVVTSTSDIRLATGAGSRCVHAEGRRRRARRRAAGVAADARAAAPRHRNRQPAPRR